jgi:hypothetical protein
MTPAEIVTALGKHDTHIAVEGERVRLVSDGKAPPEHLVRAAREAKAALREIVGMSSPKPAGAPDVPPLPEHVANGLMRLQVLPPLWDVSRSLARRGGPKSPKLSTEAPSSGIHKPDYSAGGMSTYTGSIRPRPGPGTMHEALFLPRSLRPENCHHSCQCDDRAKERLRLAVLPPSGRSRRGAGVVT